MKEHPILFNGEMVRAILEGRKTQTRRAVSDFQSPKHDPDSEFENLRWTAGGVKHARWGFMVSGKTFEEMHEELAVLCPFGKPGDRIWVRETIINGSDGTWFYAAQSKNKWSHLQNVPKEWDLKNQHRGTIPTGLSFGGVYRKIFSWTHSLSGSGQLRQRRL